MPVIREHPSLGRQFLAPHVGPAIVPAARGKFVLRFGRQALSCPGGECLSIAMGDMDDRMVRRRGFGLGLSLVRDVALRAGGDVSVESTSSAGTTFLLRLPVAG